MDIIKVSSTSRTSAVAGAIAGVIRESNKAEVQAIGAGAVNQAVKAVILANGYLKEESIHIACIPEFVDVEIDDKVRTAIKLVIEPMTVNTERSFQLPKEPRGFSEESPAAAEGMGDEPEVPVVEPEEVPVETEPIQDVPEDAAGTDTELLADPGEIPEDI